MVPKKHAGAPPAGGAVVAAAIGRVPEIIITRADRGVWDECCVRAGVDARDRRVRHVTIGPEGIRVRIARQADVLATWSGPVVA